MSNYKLKQLRTRTAWRVNICWLLINNIRINASPYLWSVLTFSVTRITFCCSTIIYVWENRQLIVFQNSHIATVFCFFFIVSYKKQVEDIVGRFGEWPTSRVRELAPYQILFFLLRVFALCVLLIQQSLKQCYESSVNSINKWRCWASWSLFVAQGYERKK